ncbi:MAG: hypothetical protein MI919_18335, partial [Holophagales bacterium]|nr:hypothetical protein [Holophagales bacterium]
WSTVVRSAGGEPAPGEAPDLFRAEGGPMISSLYVQGGRNQVSLVAEKEPGVVQLHWIRTVFEDPELFAAQAMEAGARGIQLSRTPRTLHRRLDAVFSKSLPLTGERGPELRLDLWGEAGGAHAFEDPVLERTMARELRRAWLRFVGEERSYEDESRLWDASE